MSGRRPRAPGGARFDLDVNFISSLEFGVTQDTTPAVPAPARPTPGFFHKARSITDESSGHGSPRFLGSQQHLDHRMAPRRPRSTPARPPVPGHRNGPGGHLPPSPRTRHTPRLPPGRHRHRPRRLRPRHGPHHQGDGLRLVRPQPPGRRRRPAQPRLPGPDPRPRGEPARGTGPARRLRGPAPPLRGRRPPAHPADRGPHRRLPRPRPAPRGPLPGRAPGRPARTPLLPRRPPATATCRPCSTPPGRPAPPRG